MKRLQLVLLAAVLPLAVAVPANAKEFVKAKICGASDCVETKDHRVLGLLMEGGTPGGPPASGAAWYRVRVLIDAEGEHHAIPMVVAPRAGIMGTRWDPAGDYTWIDLFDSTAAAFTQVTRGLEPRPAADLPGAPAPDTPQSARVDEVVQVRPAGDTSGGAATWPWLIAAGGSICALGAGAWVRRRRRRPGGRHADPGASGATS